MRLIVLMFCLLAAAASLQADAARRTASARPQTLLLTGRLEMVWGDLGPRGDMRHGSAQSLHRLALVDDAGVRHRLDYDQALRAAAKLHTLYGKRVAVEVQAPSPVQRSPGKARSAAQRPLLAPLAMVPIGDLTPPGRPGRVAARDAAESIAGNTVWVTLPCKFADVEAATKSQSFFQGQFENGGGLRRYWSEVSFGAININGSTARDWKVLPEPRSGYIDIEIIDGVQYWDANLDKLYEHCMALHDPEVNFAAGNGVYGVILAFNEELDGAAWGGSRCEVRDGLDACRGVNWMPSWSMEDLAVLGHEMGHGYGLPHVNNSDRDGDPYDNPWDVMSSSRTHNFREAGYGRYPKHINAYNRARLGWMPEARVRTVAPGEGPLTVTLDRLNLPFASNVQMLVLRDSSNSGRYYILETRTRSGFYDINLPGDGVIIYEVDESRGTPAWSQDADVPPADFSNNEGSMFKPGETWVSPDHLFRVRVDAATESGFQLTVLPIPRKSGPHPALRVETPAPVSAPAAPAPARTPAAGPAQGRDRR